MWSTVSFSRGLRNKPPGQARIKKVLREASPRHSRMLCGRCGPVLIGTTTVPTAKAELPAGLSPREAELLAALAHSLITTPIARHLGSVGPMDPGRRRCGTVAEMRRSAG